MIAQSGQHVVAVLPDRFCNDETGVGMNGLEDVHAHTLAGNESVLFMGIVGVTALDGNAFCRKCLDDALFHIVLGGPALLVSGQAQVPAGDQNGLFGAGGAGSATSGSV